MLKLIKKKKKCFHSENLWGLYAGFFQIRRFIGLFLGNGIPFLLPSFPNPTHSNRQDPAPLKSLSPIIPFST